MLILRVLLIGPVLLIDSEVIAFRKSRAKLFGDGLIPFTPVTLNRARFLKFQQAPLRRLPTRQERRKSTGAPVIVCGEGVMGIVLKHPFNGRIFASHREKDPECLQYVTKLYWAKHTLSPTRWISGVGLIQKVPNTLAKFLTSLDGQCGVWSKKSFISSAIDFHLRVVVSFGYDYLTEEDKIYDLTCSYSSQNISIEAYYDTVNFVALPVRNNSVLPKCHYSLRLNALDGPRIQSAIVGELVYHRWSCPSEEFAFKVYRCYIHNGLHQSYLIINDNGCSLDESIMPHPTYDFSQDLVYTASKAFRFTKSRRVFFNCMLSVCHRADDDCMREIPPRCPHTLRKRHLSDEFSVEERLERLRMREHGGNHTGNDRPFDFAPIVNDHYVSYREIEPTPMIESLSFIKDGPFVPACERSDNSQWIYALLITNFLSVLVVLLMCGAAVRHRHSVDVAKVQPPHSSLY